MENNKIINEGCKKVKDAGPKPVGIVGTAIEGAAAMPSSSNVECSAITMSDTSNSNEVGGVPVPTARASTEKASSSKQIPERVAEEASGNMSDSENFLQQYPQR